jgi:hypothetical protein
VFPALAVKQLKEATDMAGILFVHQAIIHKPGRTSGLLKHVRDAKTPDSLFDHPLNDGLDAIMIDGAEGRNNVESVFGKHPDSFQQFGPTSRSLKNPIGKAFVDRLDAQGNLDLRRLLDQIENCRVVDGAIGQ